ncbi:MAG TPA: TIGR02757 family protein [Candidatus Acidoferrales bacterium]|nr:TIGR02757 family protein [Candidatus Acidoferrales bacterium]
MEGLKLLQKIFESHLEKKSLKDFYLSDPVCFPKRFRNKNDIETAAFVSAMFAIGPRYAILRSLEKIFSILGDSPYHAIHDLDGAELAKKLNGHIQFAYKNITGTDVVQILLATKSILNRYVTIENALLSGRNGSENLVSQMLTRLLEEMKSVRLDRKTGRELTPRARALLASPKDGSACKRMNMFLRWMTRDDEIDFGFYNWLGKQNLVIPLDVNVSRAARKLKLTKRKTDNWKTALEVTDRLRSLDPLDPVKYDVPLFLYGMELRKSNSKL